MPVDFTFQLGYFGSCTATTKASGVAMPLAGWLHASTW